MVDATPDSRHIEQTTFILRFLTKANDSYVINERFLAFVDCCQKTGIDIANLILETLKEYRIPIEGKVTIMLLICLANTMVHSNTSVQ